MRGWQLDHPAPDTMKHAITPKFFGEVRDGKLELEDRAGFAAYLSTLKGQLEIVVRKFRFQRTVPQNNLYWLYLGVIASDTGDNANDLHEYFKRTKLPPKNITVMKKTITIPRSTTELSKGEFSDYMEAIREATDIPIPDWELVDL